MKMFENKRIGNEYQLNTKGYEKPKDTRIPKYIKELILNEYQKISKDIKRYQKI